MGAHTLLAIFSSLLCSQAPRLVEFRRQGIAAHFYPEEAFYCFAAKPNSVLILYFNFAVIWMNQLYTVRTHRQRGFLEAYP